MGSSSSCSTAGNANGAELGAAQIYDPRVSESALAPDAQARRGPATALSTAIRIGEIIVFGVVPALLLAKLTHEVLTGPLPHDFAVFFGAGDDVLAGRSPYPPVRELVDDTKYVYPPPLALLIAPLAVLPAKAALACWFLLLFAATAGALRLMGVDDWRCYGIALLFVPTRDSLGGGTVNPLLLLGIALAWRYREAVFGAATAIGAVVALKVFLWPMFFWLAATRRYRAALLAMATAGVLALGSWAVLGFEGLTDYLALLRKLSRLEADGSYSVYAVGRAVGAPSGLAVAATAIVGAVLLAVAVYFGRKHRFDAVARDRLALTYCIVAALVLSPIVWWHYFMLLLVPAALARPRLAGVWLLLFATAVLPLVGHPLVAWPNGAFYPLATAATFMALVLACIIRGDHNGTADGASRRTSEEGRA
jgi:Glycosyltransferase family 87